MVFDNDQIRIPGLDTSRYYIPDSMSLVYCGACLIVALQSSESARQRYTEIVNSFKLSENRNFFCKLEDETQAQIKLRESITRPPSKKRLKDKSLTAARAMSSSFTNTLINETKNILPKYNQDFSLESGKVFNEDLKLLIGLISDFIDNEFNYPKGKNKIEANNSSLLIITISLRALAEYKHVEMVDEDKQKGIRISGKFYDFTNAWQDDPNTRKHRATTKYYTDAGFMLKHDNKIFQAAERWYQCRVVHGSIKKYCEYMADKGFELDPYNISNEIKICDKAMGYPRSKS
jgi:hypothetical protein